MDDAEDNEEDVKDEEDDICTVYSDNSEWNDTPEYLNSNLTTENIDAINYSKWYYEHIDSLPPLPYQYYLKFIEAYKHYKEGDDEKGKEALIESVNKITIIRTKIFNLEMKNYILLCMLKKADESWIPLFKNKNILFNDMQIYISNLTWKLGEKQLYKKIDKLFSG